MKKLIFIVIISVSWLASFGQSGGVHFEQGLTWQQVLAKAKAEHKYIFVDCYATWCGPCKQMDKETYPVDSLGTFVNAHFINVKVQIDRTDHDNDTVKAWYNDAITFEKAYAIKVYPTLLFFDENGEAVHKAAGFKDADAFIQTAKEAQDTNQQYFTLLNAYVSGKLPYGAMPRLAAKAKRLDEKKLANKIAMDYLHNYLDKLNEKDFIKQANVDFITSYPDILTSSDRLFRLCFDDPAKVDTALHNKTYASWLVNKVIYQEEVDPKVKAVWANGPEPDWSAIAAGIGKKFGKKYVEDNVLKAKISWYKHRKDGRSYTHYLTIKINNDLQHDGIHNQFAAILGFNNSAWDVFQYDPDTADLQKAILWEDAVLKFIGKPYATAMDTKANLLYKLGNKEKAIALETQAAQTNPDDKSIARCLTLMKAGEKTWPDKMQ